MAGQFPQIPAKAFEESVQLVRPDGTVASGARAVFETLGRERLYESSRLLASVSEGAYRFIAQRRSLFYQVTRIAFGTRIEPARFAATEWLFLRALALIYAVAFASLSVQVLGLIGRQGILPARDFLQRIASSFGLMRLAALPTIFWWNASDPMLQGAAIAGIVLAAAAYFGYWERGALMLLYVLYLSYSSAGQVFLSFQWDSLLLEAGFLAIFFGRSGAGLRTTAWLYRWLVFRLYFLSGFVKLGSHDPTWSGFTALKYHFHTQPLPTVFAYFADKLPDGFQRFATFDVLAIELGTPFLIFAPRRIRMAGAWIMLFLQALIFLTGNYTFFNLLTMALILFLFDDQALRRFVPAKVRVRLDARPRESAKPARVGMAVLTVVVLVLGCTRIIETIEGAAPPPLDTLANVTGPFEIVNGYGLFAVMTTTRPEIIVEGSNDGEHWLPYEFRYKPGDVHNAPRWAAPFQPRLDWQMWFAALTNYQSNPWFVNFMLRLLQGSPHVLGLLETNPFPERPPKFVRAQVYEYSFTDFATLRRTGAWWKRQESGSYLPAVGLHAAGETR